jgi:hypothetical protein
MPFLRSNHTHQPDGVDASPSQRSTTDGLLRIKEAAVEVGRSLAKRLDVKHSIQSDVGSSVLRRHCVLAQVEELQDDAIRQAR